MEENHEPKPAVERTNPFYEFFSLFIPAKGYFITPILANVTIAIFVIMAFCGVDVLSPDGEDLISWGANFRPLTLQGEYWRLITSCFLHIGIIHLAMNMYALVYIGVLLEPYLGKTGFFGVYLLTGIAGSAASVWWHEATISAGASGAIFGMYGIFLAMLTTNLIEKEKRQDMLASIGLFVAYNLVMGFRDGIDNAAHLGGLLSGAAAGYALYPALSKADTGKVRTTLSALVVSTLVVCFAVLQSLPNHKDLGRYDEDMKAFYANQDAALKVFEDIETAPAAAKAKELHDVALYKWNENLQLIKGFESYDLPDHVKFRNASLTEYCELRIRQCNALSKALEENTDKYDKEIKTTVMLIEQLLDRMNKPEEDVETAEPMQFEMKEGEED